jgi:basic amino acid/polyamine antiporter, APA family
MRVPVEAGERSLKRALGLGHVSLTGIGVILGAGVYALIGPAAAHAGQALWLAFVVAGVAAVMTAYSYARLGGMRPKASPEFQYTTLAFGPRVGFLAGWLMLAGDVAAAASVALGFGGYLGNVAGTGTIAGALGLVVVAGLIVCAGVGESVRLAIALTLVEAAGLVFVVVIGVPAWERADYTTMPHGGGGVLSAAALIFFAYLGFDELGNLAEEMRRPERDLPRALFISVAATTIIYVAVALSATAIVPAAALGASPAPLALVVRTALGPTADVVLSVMALAATANTVLLLLLAGSRSVYGMAADGVLPPRLARLSRTQIPLAATLVVLAATAVLVTSGDLSAVARLTDAMVLMSFIAVNLSLAYLGLRGRTRARGIGRTADVAVPALGAVLCGGLLVEGGWTWIAAACGVAGLGAALAAVSAAQRSEPR